MESYAIGGMLILFVIALFAVLAWWGQQSKISSNSINVYYCTEIPQEAAAADGLRYLQNNANATGHYLMDNVQLVPFATDTELNSALGNYIRTGGKIAVLTSGSELLTSVLPLIQSNPTFELLNMYSTIPLSKPYPNLYRFAFSDDTTFPYVINIIPASTIVYYDPDNVWASDSGNYFQNRGYTAIAYPGANLPTSVPYLIIATTLTPTLIDRVPMSCPKLYGLDGSIFYPLTGDTSAKASTMEFECVQYFPPITSPLIANIQQQVGADFSYIFPTALDGIGYARNYLNGFSNNTIQTTTTGFSGSLVFTDNSRTYGNLEWYTFSTSGWNLSSTILIDTNGSCTING